MMLFRGVVLLIFTGCIFAGIVSFNLWDKPFICIISNTINTDDPQQIDKIHYTSEIHLKNVRQITFSGENAEAYFSFDNTRLIFQRTATDLNIHCDQIFYTEIPSDYNLPFEYKMVSTSKGRTTCAYFLSGDTTFLYASTHDANSECPKVPDRFLSGQYVWPIYKDYEIYVANLNGKLLERLTDNDFYDAEATVSPKGDKIVFTSTRNGDLDIYTMDSDGSNVKQITTTLGYDGGAFFSPDGTKLIFRASRPRSEDEVSNYRRILGMGLVAPGDLELFICNIDGSEMQQITSLGGANWAPYFHPSGKKIIFSSNKNSKTGFPFNLFMVNVDGSELEQITFDNTFDSFPMFSSDGTKLVWASNRNNGGTRDTNLFIADWIEDISVDQD